MWNEPHARGSPVASYSVCVHAEEAEHAGAAIDVAFATYLPRSNGCSVVCSRTRERSCEVPLRSLDASQMHWFTVVAHSAAGDSMPSAPAALRRAPSPISFVADDDGDCQFGAGDTLTLTFDAPTNLALASSDDRSLDPVDLAQLIEVVTARGKALGANLTGVWVSDRELTISPRVPDAAAGPAPAASAPTLSGLVIAEPREPRRVEPYLQQLSARVRPAGRLTVGPAYGISPVADGVSPPLSVPGCTLDGFERERLHSWLVQSADADGGAYSFTLDGVAHTGSQSLRVTGGSGGQFDGIMRTLPAGSRVARLSCWLRTATYANVGYLALGGPSLRSSVIFFHLRQVCAVPARARRLRAPTLAPPPQDGYAGLLDPAGYFEAAPYQVLTWIHVDIRLDWSARSADLRIDGRLVKAGVGFAGNDANQAAGALQLFNLDYGTVWWDDLTLVHA